MTASGARFVFYLAASRADNQAVEGDNLEEAARRAVRRYTRCSGRPRRRVRIQVML